MVCSWQWCVLPRLGKVRMGQIRVGNGTLATVQWEGGCGLLAAVRRAKVQREDGAVGGRVRGEADETRELVVLRFVRRAVVASTVCGVQCAACGEAAVAVGSLVCWSG